MLNFHRSSLCNLFHHLPFPNLQSNSTKPPNRSWCAARQPKPPPNPPRLQGDIVDFKISISSTFDTPLHFHHRAFGQQVAFRHGHFLASKCPNSSGPSAPARHLHDKLIIR